MLTAPVELLVFTCPESDRVMNFSPFCAKSEAELRLCGIPYKLTVFSGNPASLPKGKLPVLVDSGRKIADSFFIHEHLKAMPEYRLDGGLTPLQHADGFAYAKLCEEFLYWAVLFERWGVDSNWRVLRDLYFGNIPALIRGPITSIIRRGALKSAKGHGMARHSVDEIMLLGEQSLSTIAARLGENDFLLGSEPTSYDATIYGFLINVIDGGQINPRMAAYGNGIPTIVNYCERVYNRFGNRAPRS